MDIRQMELAAEIVFRMCQEHPEICPHKYEWTHTSKTIVVDGKSTETITYRCSICGKEITETVEVKE